MIKPLLVRPILFSTPMVQAILDGRKTQTRRTIGLDEVNSNPDTHIFVHEIGANARTHKSKNVFRFQNMLEQEYIDISSYYGEAGDILWVRETLYQNGELGLEYVADKEGIDEDIIPQDYGPYGGEYSFRQIPNIHMPRWAARIFLRIKSVKVERLEDITEPDAIAEGVSYHSEVDDPEFLDATFKNYITGGYDLVTSYSSFQSLWIFINGKESWNSNPWVWVLEFERIEKPSL